MSTQRIYQLLMSFAVLAVLAFISERSHVLAAVGLYRGIEWWLQTAR